MPGQAIWCLGTYASASTWLFNIVRQILETAQKETVHTAFISGVEKKLVLGPPGTVTIIKSHEISSESRILDVAKHSRKILITVRDPRDAVTSLIEAHKYEFEKALDLVEQSDQLCLSFAKDHRALVLHYESKFFEKAETVTAVARYLGYELPENISEAIHQGLTRAEVEKHINKMPKLSGILKDAVSGDLLDIKTQWHSHHAGRNGAIGKWKKALTAKQTDEVERRIDFYFEKFQAL